MPRTLLWSLPLLAVLAAPHARAAAPTPVDFRTDVIAALSRAGCNSGACHGAPQGKNGFRLSLRGFDSSLDLYRLGTGEAAVLVRYLDQIRSARLTYVRTDPKFVHQAPPPANDIDKHVFAKQKELQLNPAPLCSDEVFLRRVHLDTIGVLPTADEAR